MHPASNIKLFTTAAALSVLDTNYQFKTAAFADGFSSNGSVIRNIYLKGYGDPDLITSDLDSLALEVRRLGISAVVRDIIVDDSYFDDIYWGKGWMWDDDSDPDAPYINALSVNNNCIRATLLADSNSSFIYLDPMTDFVATINNAKRTIDSIRTPAKIKCSCLNNPNTIIAEGELHSFDQLSQKLALRNPQYYAGNLFKESLRHAGVKVLGNVISGSVPNDLREIAQIHRSISSVITNMNKASNNLSAENTLKILGAAKYGTPGTSKNGINAVKDYLSSIGIDTSKMSIADGSGVSRYNLMTTDQIVQFLAAIYKQPRIFPIFYNSLPVASLDGTLTKRMRTYPASYNLRAKTGTLNDVTCLSGYVITRDGEMLAFSIMMQHFIGSVDDYRHAQDRICSLLAEFSRNIISK
jgi:D-alanyl-D-alanine carboxypeptidase/D-alanyl-D-alanine-endopeptidase (penicillin-binding protein 4)